MGTGEKDPFWRQEGGVSRRLRMKLTQMWVEVVWGEGVTCQMLHLTGQNTTEGQVWAKEHCPLEAASQGLPNREGSKDSRL